MPSFRHRAAFAAAAATCLVALLAVPAAALADVGGYDPPIAVADSASTAYDTSVTIDVLANDTGVRLSLAGVAPASDGTAAAEPDDTVTFTPRPGYAGTATFDYTVEDAFGQTVHATVTVVVTPPPGPVLAPQMAVTTGYRVPVGLDLLAGATGEEVAVQSVGAAAGGTVSAEDGGVVTFTPDLGFTGATTVPFVVVDRFGQEASGTAGVVVTPPPAPVAENDYLFACAHIPVSVDVLANDTGTGLRVTAAEANTGTATIAEDGTVHYLSASDAHAAIATISYTATDEVGQTASATVGITVMEPDYTGAPPMADPGEEPGVLPAPDPSVPGVTTPTVPALPALPATAPASPSSASTAPASSASTATATAPASTSSASTATSSAPALSTSTPTTVLADTGADPVIPAMVAVAAIVGGSGILILRRRRVTA